MSNLNKVLLVGRLGKDPELRYTADGTPVATFTMATSETFKDKSGTKQERTEWHTIVAWRKLAEIAGEYLKKGRLVYIEGKIQSREWEGKDGIKRRQYEIIASDMKMFPTGQGQSQGQSYPHEERKSAGSSSRAQYEDDFVPEDDVPM
jgi:single-strand DNA-binding protein